MSKEVNDYYRLPLFFVLKNKRIALSLARIVLLRILTL